MATTSIFINQTRFIKTLNPTFFHNLLLQSPTNPTTLSLFLHHPTLHSFPINTLLRRSHPSLSLPLFRLMLHLSIPPDPYTLPLLLTSLSNLPSPYPFLTTHSFAVKVGFCAQIHVSNALITGYSKFGVVDRAVKVFVEMLVRDVVSWSAVFGGFVGNGLVGEAVGVFREMQVCGVAVDEVSMVSVCMAVASLGMPELGIWSYGYVRRRGLRLTVSLGTSLVVMLGRCGFVGRAMEVFEGMEVRNSQTWTAMIVGLAEHGRSREALSVFRRMMEEGFRPDHVTFVGVLTACSHGGLVEEGMELFERIERDFGLVPWMDHYGCVVDLLGRAGRVEDAFGFVDRMPIEPNVVVWRTLLAACVAHARTELAKHVREKIMAKESDHDGDYVLMSNVFGGAGQWSEKAGLRVGMRDQGIAKRPAWSATYF